MKKIKLVNLFWIFMLLASIPLEAKCSPVVNIPMHKKGSHVRQRTEEPDISASLEQGILTININRYLGMTKVYVNDTNGNNIMCASAMIEGKGSCSIDLMSLESNINNVIVELGEQVYWGVLNFKEE